MIIDTIKFYFVMQIEIEESSNGYIAHYKKYNISGNGKSEHDAKRELTEKLLQYFQYSNDEVILIG
jgi:hypothetical protein